MAFEQPTPQPNDDSIPMEFQAGEPEPGSDLDQHDIPTTPVSVKKRLSWGQIWEGLLRLGLGEVSLRLGTALASIVLILLVVWVMRNFYLAGTANPPGSSEVVEAAPLPSATATIGQPTMAVFGVSSYTNGLVRLAQLHTNIPAKPRVEVEKYIVQKGDTIFGIAQKFNLKPETILWGNYYILVDDPHRLRPGQELNILPVDGVYYRWSAGDGLNGVAKFFGVKPEDIINWAGNRLVADKLGDWSHPNIEAGTFLVIPGGHREFISWSAPRITRQNPGVAKIFGPGFCGTVTDGPIGNGTFNWPTSEHYLSGFDYSPETNHYGLDFAGKLGNAVFAVDNGVVVYAGWNNWGYGNVIVIDHGNGWQSLYAHLSALNVGCSSYVYQGDVIGAVGSTGNSSGPHLHFELRSDQYGRPNPWNFLPVH